MQQNKRRSEEESGKNDNLVIRIVVNQGVLNSIIYLLYDNIYYCYNKIFIVYHDK